jgi:hypothetical protein
VDRHAGDLVEGRGPDRTGRQGDARDRRLVSTTCARRRLRPKASPLSLADGAHRASRPRRNDASPPGRRGCRRHGRADLSVRRPARDPGRGARGRRHSRGEPQIFRVGPRGTHGDAARVLHHAEPVGTGSVATGGRPRQRPSLRSRDRTRPARQGAARPAAAGRGRGGAGGVPLSATASGRAWSRTRPRPRAPAGLACFHCPDCSRLHSLRSESRTYDGQRSGTTVDLCFQHHRRAGRGFSSLGPAVARLPGVARTPLARLIAAPRRVLRVGSHRPRGVSDCHLPTGRLLPSGLPGARSTLRLGLACRGRP